MKSWRVAAFGLVVVVCLLAAAPALADGGGRGPASRIAAAERVDDWIPALLARVAAWLGWGETGEGAGGEPRPAYGTSCGDHGGGMDPNGTPCPTTNGDHGGHIDPNG